MRLPQYKSYRMTKKQVNLLLEEVDSERTRKYLLSRTLKKNATNEISLIKYLIEALREHKTLAKFADSDLFVELYRLYRTKLRRRKEEFILLKRFVLYVKEIRIRKKLSPRIIKGTKINFANSLIQYFENMLASNQNLLDKILTGYLSKNDKNLFQTLINYIGRFIEEWNFIVDSTDEKLYEAEHEGYKLTLDNVEGRIEILLDDGGIIVKVGFDYFHSSSDLVRIVKIIDVNYPKIISLYPWGSKDFTKPLNEQIRKENRHTLRVYTDLDPNLFRREDGRSRKALDDLRKMFNLDNERFTYTIDTYYRISFLALSDKKLVTIPKDVFSLHNLKSLFLNGNKLNNVPTSVKRLKNLTTLFLKQNLFTQFPRELLCLERLELLSFSNNQITTLPQDIDKLQNLERLELDQNDLKSLPKKLLRMDKLRALDLIGNRNITEDNPTVKKLRKKGVVVILKDLSIEKA